MARLVNFATSTCYLLAVTLYLFFLFSCPFLHQTWEILGSRIFWYGKLFFLGAAEFGLLLCEHTVIAWRALSEIFYNVIIILFHRCIPFDS